MEFPKTMRVMSNMQAEGFEVVNGMQCEMMTKAALLLKFACYEAKGQNLMIKLIMDKSELRKKYLTPDDDTGFKQLRLGIEDLEYIFDTVMGNRTLEDIQGSLDASGTIYAEALAHNREVMEVDSMGYLVFGIIKNERCLQKLEEYVCGRENELYSEYRESGYNSKAILRMFLQKERRMAGLLIGLICKARKEKGSSWYNDLMEIICSGHRAFKNQIKRMDIVRMNAIKDIVSAKDNLMLNYGKAVIYLAIAEHLDIPVDRDYDFYVFIYCLWFHVGNFSKEFEKIELSEEGREYRKTIRKSCNLKSFYDNVFNDARMAGVKAPEDESIYLEDEDEEVNLIFQSFHMNLRAFSDYELDDRQADALCEILSERQVDAKEYSRMLLTATLCKYISELEKLCTENSKEELDYQALKKERERFQKMQEDFAEEKERISQAKNRVADELQGKERESERLKEQISRMELDREAERQELAALRNYVFQQQKEEIGNRQNSWSQKLQQLMSCKLVVVGGHPNWQNKLKEYFSQAVFVEADNLSFDLARLRDLDYIIINAGVLKHACYYRVLSAKEKTTKILYVSSNNMELCLKELQMQLE